MRSSDFLTNDEVFGRSIRMVVLIVLVFSLAELAFRGVIALLGSDGDRSARAVLVGPFFLAAVYGNVPLQRVRVQHDIQPFTRPWWPRITLFATAQTVLLVVMSFAIEWTLWRWGWIAGDARVIDDLGLACAVTGGVALLMCLCPAKGQIHL